MSLRNSIQFRDSIAIIGIGCRLPGDINSINDFWQVLKNGKDVIRLHSSHSENSVGIL